jgi:hypothetical protein
MRPFRLDDGQAVSGGVTGGIAAAFLGETATEDSGGCE